MLPNSLAVGLTLNPIVHKRLLVKEYLVKANPRLTTNFQSRTHLPCFSYSSSTHVEKDTRDTGTDGFNTKGTRTHAHRELIRVWLWEPKRSSLESIEVLGGESTPRP